MTKILLYGEGPHEIGYKEWSPRKKRHVTTDGWLQPMATRLRASTGSVEARPLHSLISLPGNNQKTAHLSALGKKALLALTVAESSKFAAVVFATDADTVHPREQAAKVAEIEAGFQTYTGAVAGIAAVPMGMSEAWLLADPDAWTAIGATAHAKLPKRPEASWGAKDDPESGRPKHVFAAMCEANDIDDHAGTRRDIAEQANFDTVAQRCPISFAPFRAALAAI